MNEKHIISDILVKFQNIDHEEKSLKLPEKTHVYAYIYIYIFHVQNQENNLHPYFQQPL